MASLKELPATPESEAKTESLAPLLPSTKGTTLMLLFREPHTLHNNIIRSWSEKRSFLLFCTFLKPRLVMEPQEITQLDTELKKLNLMLENVVTSVVKKREVVAVKNKFAADLYHALVCIPIIVSCGLLQHDIIQLSQSHTIDGKNILNNLSWPKESLPLLQNILEQKEVAPFLATEITKVTIQNVGDIIFYSSIVDAAEIMTGKNQFLNSAKNHISSQALKIAIRVKDQALVFFNTLFKQLQLSFAITDKSREQLFAIVEATYTLRPLLLIQDNHFIKKDIDHIDLAIHSIQNGCMHLLNVINKKSSKNKMAEPDLQLLKESLEQAISMIQQLPKAHEK